MSLGSPDAGHSAGKLKRLQAWASLAENAHYVPAPLDELAGAGRDGPALLRMRLWREYRRLPRHARAVRFDRAQFREHPLVAAVADEASYRRALAFLGGRDDAAEHVARALAVERQLQDYYGRGNPIDLDAEARAFAGRPAAGAELARFVAAVVLGGRFFEHVWHEAGCDALPDADRRSLLAAALQHAAQAGRADILHEVEERWPGGTADDAAFTDAARGAALIAAAGGRAECLADLLACLESRVPAGELTALALCACHAALRAGATSGASDDEVEATLHAAACALADADPDAGLPPILAGLLRAAPGAYRGEGRWLAGERPEPGAGNERGEPATPERALDLARTGQLQDALREWAGCRVERSARPERYAEPYAHPMMLAFAAAGDRVGVALLEDDAPSDALPEAARLAAAGGHHAVVARLLPRLSGDRAAVLAVACASAAIGDEPTLDLAAALLGLEDWSGRLADSSPLADAATLTVDVAGTPRFAADARAHAEAWTAVACAAAAGGQRRLAEACVARVAGERAAEMVRVRDVARAAAFPDICLP